MSLDDILGGHAARAFLGTLIRPPASGPVAPVRVPATTASPDRTATALGYALRLGVQARFPARGPDGFPVADAGMVKTLWAKKHRAHEVDGLTELLKHAKRVARTVGEGPLRRAQARACCTLASFNILFLRAAPPNDLEDLLDGLPGPGEIAELVDLYDLVPWGAVCDGGPILVQPTFNGGQELVHGARGDLLVGDALLAFDASAGPQVPARVTFDLVSFASLIEAHGVDSNGPRPVREIGVYRARSGELVRWPLDEVVDAPARGEIRRWLARRGWEPRPAGMLSRRPR
jgi:hypothetical protein